MKDARERQVIGEQKEQQMRGAFSGMTVDEKNFYQYAPAPPDRVAEHISQVREVTSTAFPLLLLFLLFQLGDRHSRGRPDPQGPGQDEGCRWRL